MRCSTLRGPFRVAISKKQLKKSGAASLVMSTFQYLSMTSAGKGSCCRKMRVKALVTLFISMESHAPSENIGA